MNARVVLHGTAVDIETGGARRHRVRAVDLPRRLGEPSLGMLAGASLDGDRLELELAGGGRDSVSLAELAPAGRRGERRAELVIRGARIATCDGDPGEPLGLHDDHAVVCGGGRILWLGPSAEIDSSGLDVAGASHLEAAGRLLTPGLIDCHAHPIFAGDRAGEFAMRAAGRSYREIGAAGGGIRATVGPTREADLEALIDAASPRIRRALEGGVTTMEAKSGYDLRVEGELRMLEVAGVIDALGPADLQPTLLGAHVLPAERAGDRAAYVADVAGPMVEGAAAARLAAAVDVYCDENAFTLEETRTILESARRAGLGIKAHVGQFADLGGPELLAELGGLSADHLEQISDAGIAAMAAHGVVAVMLPGACVQLRMTPPPIEALRAAGVTLAVASDMNPGSSFCEGLVVPMWLATTHYGMTVEETWLGVTRHAARALGRVDIGTLTPGARADLVLWDAEQPAEIPYRFGANLARRVIKSGRLVA